MHTVVWIKVSGLKFLKFPPEKHHSVLQAQSKDRLQRLHKWCSTDYSAIKSRQLQTGDFDHIYVNEQYKVLYCRIPKAGCTNWKKYFILLAGM